MKVLMIVLNNFRHDSRVLKELGTLEEVESVQKIDLYAIWAEGLNERESLDSKTTIHRIKCKVTCKFFLCKILRTLELMFKIININKNKEIDIIHAHDIPALPIAIILKKLKKVKLIYDSHEIQSEICRAHKYLKKIIFFIENMLIKHVDEVIVVSESIQDWYHHKFNVKNIHVLRNIPLLDKREKKNVQLRRRLGINDDDILFIYVGNLVKKERGIEEFLEVFNQNSFTNKHILFMGKGELCTSILNYSESTNTIHYINPVDTSEILNYVSEADIGINLGKRGCLNSYFGIANKLFEYMLSGLAIIVSDFPERERLIRKYDCGWVIHTEDIYDLNAIEKLVIDIDIEDVQLKKANSLNNIKNISWEDESKVLYNIYQDIL